MEAMRTIHIENQSMQTIYEISRFVFASALVDDPKSHFLYEKGPILIFRMNNTSKEKVENILESEKIPYFDYPYPKLISDPAYTRPPELTHVFEEWDFITEYLDAFLPAFHANCVAALAFKNEEIKEYLERVVHTACNARIWDDYKLLVEMAIKKIGRQAVDEVADTFASQEWYRP